MALSYSDGGGGSGGERVSSADKSIPFTSLSYRLVAYLAAKDAPLHATSGVSSENHPCSSDCLSFLPSVCPSVRLFTRARPHTHGCTYVRTSCVCSRDFHWRWLLRPAAAAARIIEVQACPAGSNHSTHTSKRTSIRVYICIYICIYLSHSFTLAQMTCSLTHSPRLPPH